MRRLTAIVFFFNDTATTEIYTLSLHDALPIFKPYLQLDRIIEAAFHTAERLFGLRFKELHGLPVYHPDVRVFEVQDADGRDRKSTRLNSSHANISYAVFCLKKKKDYSIDTPRV